MPFPQSLVMPFPLAHPAAVLPLRRWCPKYLSFAALVIGSLTPDLGNCLNWDNFSHSIPGSFAFGLPLGMVSLWILYRIRAPLVETLPDPHREALLPFCTPRHEPMLICLVSLLIGNWTHI